MRLWHKDLIDVLPDKQLVSQWRECCAIAGAIAKNGTPNHLLVNKVMDYPVLHYIMYVDLVLQEMSQRGFRVSQKAYTTMVNNLNQGKEWFNYLWFQYVPASVHDIYSDWHNNTYLIQCYHNLEEKYNCGGLTHDEWAKIVDKTYDLII